MTFRIAVLAALSCLVATTAEAQRGSLELGLSQILEAGEGVESGCGLRTYSTGLGGSLTVPIGRVLSASATGRVYPLGQSPTCFTDIFVPSNGTFTVTDRVGLEATRFLTSDLRLQVTPVAPLNISLGGGMAWHPGRDFPYLVGAVAGRLPSAGRLGFSIGAEYYRMRASWNAFSVTYANSVPITTVPIGTRHKWSSALAVSLSASLKI